MKVFRGEPGQPPTITVTEGSHVHAVEMKAPPPWWGHEPAAARGATELALALAQASAGDDIIARKVHQRLKWRTVATWPVGQPWSITDDQIKRQIDEIIQVEQETAMTRAMVAREPAPVVMEGGLGVSWDRAPDITPNRPVQAPLAAQAGVTAPEPQTPTSGDDTRLREAFLKDGGEDLSVRLFNVLVMTKCYSLEDAAKRTAAEWLLVPNFTPTCLRELEGALAEKNLVLPS